VLSRGGRPALVAALCCAAVLVLPSGAARADVIRSQQQWVLSLMDVPAAWQVTQGAGVTVAVLDSGVNGNVSDLSGSVVTGKDYTDAGTVPSDPNWGVHGTWMASLIAGHGHDNGLDGVIGIAPASRVLSIRVIPDRADPHYGKYEHEPESRIQQSLASGIRFAVQHGAKVISMSIGYGAPSATVRQALQYAYSHGVVVVASAGNSGGSTDADQRGQSPESFPADYPGVISVAAVNSSGVVASFSSDNLSVEVAAPGVSVPAQGRDGQYWFVSGTSPACALVAGVAALIKSRYPDLAPDLVVSALTSTTTDRPSRGYDGQRGFGIIDAAVALTKAGQLARERPRASSIAARTVFGGGSLLPDPVRPRSSGPLILFSLLALISLTLVAVGGTRLVTRRLREGQAAVREPQVPW
jgi:type VII secretion-associated serine protease mycosin